MTQSDLGNNPVAIPPYVEQEIIALYLDKKCGEIDKAVATQEKRVELLKELRQNIITQAVTRGINPNAPLKDSGVEWIGEVPEHWEVNRLKTLCRTIRNGYVGPTRDLYVDDGIPYIQSVHIKDGDILFEREEYYVTKDWADKHPKIYKGDIVVVQTGDIGQIALVTNKFDKCNCHALIILSINNNVISSEYLSLYLRSHIGKELMLQTKTGALLPHLNSTQIGDTTTIVPPLSEQQEIVSYIESQTVRLDKSIEKAEHQIELLQELKQSIITEVVTGKRKVV
jgi:type I restriction enzyme S subunit